MGNVKKVAPILCRADWPLSLGPLRLYFCPGAGPIPVPLQHNRNKKQFVELSLETLVEIWVTFPLPTILVFYNNAIKNERSPTLKLLVNDSFH